MIVLAVSPHPDDAEFGAGATMSRLTRAGNRVVSLALSDCRDEGETPGVEPAQLREEHAAACTVLGAESRVLDFPRRTLHLHRQRVLDELIRVRDDLRPDLVLCPARADRHQDHEVVAAEAWRAFRGTTTLGYVLPWNCPTVSVSAWRAVSSADAHRKADAIRCFTSQRARPYALRGAVLAQLVQAGLQAGTPLAEAFECIRSVS